MPIANTMSVETGIPRYW